MLNAESILSQLNTHIAGVSADTRRLSREDLFLAYPGDEDDGRHYIQQAMQCGAAAVVWDPRDFLWQSQWNIPNHSVRDLRFNAGYFADTVYQHPSREIPVVAITGTNGKTTTSSFVAQLLEASGVKTGIIGTLGMGRMGALSPLENTTPEAAIMHDGLRQMIRKQGVGAAVIEASSHGLAQGRLNGMHLRVAAFTNMGHDHLDYHDDLKDYQDSKSGLFMTPSLETAILNGDDSFCQTLQHKLSLPIKWYGHKQHHQHHGEQTTLQCMQATSHANGYELLLSYEGQTHNARLNFAGRHNVSNFIAAALIVLQLNMPLAEILEHAPRLTLPTGRLQQISERPRVFVDFAHTPDAFQAVLSEMRASLNASPTASPQHLSKQLIVVFGCGGNRDMDKRSEMGTLAQTFADVVVVTDDNPRDERPADIRAQICRAVPNAYNIGDRREAICHALSMANAHDTVLILGKGHETYQERGGLRQHFSDVAVVCEWLQTSEPTTQRAGAAYV